MLLKKVITRKEWLFFLLLSFARITRTQRNFTLTDCITVSDESLGNRTICQEILCEGFNFIHCKPVRNENSNRPLTVPAHLNQLIVIEKEKGIIGKVKHFINHLRLDPIGTFFRTFDISMYKLFDFVLEYLVEITLDILFGLRRGHMN